MIQYLSDSLDEFPRPANQTQCFVHTVNLIAKSILKPFDAQKEKDIQSFNDVAQALADSAEGTDSDDEDLEKEDDSDEDEDEGEEDNVNNELNTSLRPIRSMLLKVCLCVSET